MTTALKDLQSCFGKAGFSALETKEDSVKTLHKKGQNEDGLEAERKLLVEEMIKQNPSATVIASKMDQTFPLRRREIVEAGPPVKALKERWPALFTERQVFAEFNRIATTNLENSFFDALDRYTSRFVTIFKSKKGSVGEKLAEIVQQIDSVVSLLQRGEGFGT